MEMSYALPNTSWFGASGQPLGAKGPRVKGGAPAAPLGVEQAAAAPEKTTGGAPVKAIVIAAVLLVLARLAVDWLDAKTAIDVERIVTPSVYNFVIVGLMVVLFIAGAAVVFNRFYVPGWTEVINTVS